MFRGLSKRQLKHLASLCEVADYMADHSIVKQGDPGDALLRRAEGAGEGHRGQEFLGRIVPGDHFGEIAVLDGGPRSATVTSETPMTLLIAAERRLPQGAARRPRAVGAPDGRARSDVPPRQQSRPRAGRTEGTLTAMKVEFSRPTTSRRRSSPPPRGTGATSRSTAEDRRALRHAHACVPSHAGRGGRRRATGASARTGAS